MNLSAAASWQCVRWDTPVAVTVLPGSAPPILRLIARTGSAVCLHGHRDCTCHHDNTPPPPSQVEARLSTVVRIRPTVRLGPGPRPRKDDGLFTESRCRVQAARSSVHTVHYRARIPIQCAEYMLSVSKLETNHCTLTQTGLGSLGQVGRLTGAVTWTGHAGAAGPTRRNWNRS
jgi:hypothetical protein